jgi:hypothetical protein
VLRALLEVLDLFAQKFGGAFAGTLVAFFGFYR